MIKQSIIAFGFLLFSVSLYADSQMTFQPEIVPRVVNGKESKKGWFQSNEVLEFDLGATQIGFTLEQIVLDDGRHQKFTSPLFLLNFDAMNNERYQLSYKKFRTLAQAKQFSSKPKLELTTQQGKAVDFKLAVLHKNGFQDFIDYEREVAKYNQQRSVNHAAQIEQSEQSKRTSKMSASIKEQFLTMPREEQQAFMQWAMRNLK